MDELFQALNFRTAIKEFDTNKEVSNDNLNYILQAGRLAPSSFGLEHWKFLVISSIADKKQIEPLCFNQKQISTCSHLIIILGKIKEFHEDSEYIKEILNQRMPKQNAEYSFNIIGKFTNSMSDEQLKFWIQKQCYIATTNMMIAAAFKKIDSCPMEGFKEKELLEYLNLDSDDYSIALLLPIGYRVEEQENLKVRLPFEKIVEFKE